MLSGEFNDFKWEANVDEEDIETEDGGVDVEVTTPTGGKIALIVYGPWPDIDSFAESVSEDAESYVDIS